MRKILAFVVAVGVTGCGQDQIERSSTDSAPPPAEEESASLNVEEEAKMQMALITVNEAIQGFRLLNKRYPEDLKELVSGGPLSRMPSLPDGYGYTYDAEEGEASAEEMTESEIAATGVPTVSSEDEAAAARTEEGQDSESSGNVEDDDIDEMFSAAEEEIRATAAETEEKKEATEAEVEEIIRESTEEAEAELEGPEEAEEPATGEEADQE